MSQKKKQATLNLKRYRLMLLASVMTSLLTLPAPAEAQLSVRKPINAQSMEPPRLDVQYERHKTSSDSYQSVPVTGVSSAPLAPPAPPKPIITAKPARVLPPSQPVRPATPVAAPPAPSRPIPMVKFPETRSIIPASSAVEQQAQVYSRPSVARQPTSPPTRSVVSRRPLQPTTRVYTQPLPTPQLTPPTARYPSVTRQKPLQPVRIFVPGDKAAMDTNDTFTDNNIRYDNQLNGLAPAANGEVPPPPLPADPMLSLPELPQDNAPLVLDKALAAPAPKQALPPALPPLPAPVALTPPAAPPPLPPVAASPAPPALPPMVKDTIPMAAPAIDMPSKKLEPSAVTIPTPQPAPAKTVAKAKVAPEKEVIASTPPIQVIRVPSKKKEPPVLEQVPVIDPPTVQEYVAPEAPLPVAVAAPVGGVSAMTTVPAMPEPTTLNPETKAILDRLPSRIGTSRHSTLKGPPVDMDRINPAVDVFGDKAYSDNDDVGVKIEVRTPPADVEHQLSLGYEALNTGQSEAALEIYKRALDASPRNQDALFGLATTYHRLGQLDKARPYYGKLLSINPNHRSGLTNFLALVGEEAPQEAIQELERLELKNPDFSQIPAQLGLIYKKLGDLPKAASKMAVAMHLSPENLTYRYNLAIILDKVGNSKEAAMLYGQLLSAYERGEDLPGNPSDIQERLTFIQSN